MGGVVKQISSGVSQVGNFGGQLSNNNAWGNFTGTGQNGGLLGLGQYRTDPYTVNGAAFAPSAAEQQYIASLQQAASGQGGPSVAEQQMRAGLDQANQQAQSMAASQRGISPALAARLAAQQQAAMGQSTNANAAMLRSQEQMDARNSLGQGLQSIRAGQMGLENLRSGNANYAIGANMQGYANAAGRRADFAGGAMNGFGAMSAMGGAGGGEVPDPSTYNHTPNVPELPAVLAAYNKGKKKGGGKPGGGDKDAMSGDLGEPSADAGISGADSAPRMVSPAMNQGGEVPAASRAGKFLSQPSQPVQQMGFGGMMRPLGQPIRNPFGGMFRGSGGGGGNQSVPVSPMPRGIGVKDQSQAPRMQQLPNKPPVAFDNGGLVPGEAKVAGDSLKNDKVPALLSPKEIVLPRSVTLSEDAPARAAEFVAAVKARQASKQRKAS